MKHFRHSMVIAAALAFTAEHGLYAIPPSATPMPLLVTQFAADRHDVMKAFDLPGASIRFDRLDALHTQWLARLRTDDFDSLQRSEKMDYLLLRNEAERGLDETAFERRQWNELDSLLPFRGALCALEQARAAGAPLDSQAAATQVSELALQIKELKARIEQGMSAAPTGAVLKVSAPLAVRAASAASRLRSSLKNWFTFYDGFRPEFSWWLKKPYEETDKALDDYIKVLRETVAGLKGKDDDPLVGQPVGADALAAAIRHEIIPYDASALRALGEQEMTLCETEMKAVARKMGCGDDWKAAMARVKADFVPPGGQDALITETTRQAITFTRKHKLVTIPPLCEETWRLTMMSPETLKTIPYAAYNGQTMMVAYARDDMSNEDKLMTMRGNNRHFIRTVTPHELIPGHHLQQFLAARNHPHRAIFVTPLYIEGWALYGERRFGELGWATTPEDRLGMLFWRLNRAARVVLAIQFHLGNMSPPGMVDFLVNRVGHERLGATSEVRRFIGDGFAPLYPASYTLGALQLAALHHELVETGRMTEQDFNDAILAESAIPVEFIRASLLSLPLTRETRSSWAFAGKAGQP